MNTDEPMARLWVGLDDDYKVAIKSDSDNGAIVMPWTDAVKLGVTILTFAMFSAQSLDNDEQTFHWFVNGAHSAVLEALNSQE